jgi:integrase
MAAEKYTYVVRTLTADGHRYYVRGKTAREADDKLAELRASLKRGERVIGAGMTVRAWAEEWLADYVKPKVREPGAAKKKGTMTAKSYEMYTQKLDGYILPAIGKMKLGDVRATHLKRILNAAADDDGAKSSTLEKIRIVMHAMFNQARVDRIITFDPSEGLELPASESGKRRSLTDEERAILLRACEVHRCGLWILVLLETGIRPGESAALLVGDFDLANQSLTINKALESGSAEVSTPKTDAGFRKVPIRDNLVPLLLAAFEGRELDEIAFPQMDGKTMMTQECISNNWRSFRRCMEIVGGAMTVKRGRAYSEANDGYHLTALGRIATEAEDGFDGSVLADDLILYDLRHTYCTDLQRAGVPINVASYFMGHADIQTTAKIYTHSGDTEVASALQVLNSHFRDVANGVANNNAVREVG